MASWTTRRDPFVMLKAVAGNASVCASPMTTPLMSVGNCCERVVEVVVDRRLNVLTTWVRIMRCWKMMACVTVFSAVEGSELPRSEAGMAKREVTSDEKKPSRRCGVEMFTKSVYLSVSLRPILDGAAVDSIG